MSEFAVPDMGQIAAAQRGQGPPDPPHAPPGVRRVPIRCANVMHNTGSRRGHPDWNQLLGFVDVAATGAQDQAAFGYICNACREAAYLPALAAWQGAKAAHDTDPATNPDPGPVPDPLAV